MNDLPKIVEQRLRNTDVRGIHPDPSLLTGFVERVLPPRMRLDLVDHLSVCSECRLVVALAKSSATDTELAVQQVYGWRPLGWSVLRWASGVATAVVVAGSLLVVRTVWVAQHETPRNPVVATVVNSQSTQQASIPQTIAPKGAVTRSLPSSERVSSPIAPTSPSMVETSTNINQMLEVGRRANPITGSSALPAVKANTSDIEDSPVVSTILWRIAGPGIVYESFDAGRSWQSVTIRENTVFRCVTSIESTVWAGGDAGALFRSDDNGQHWTQVPLFGDTQAIPTDAIAAIQFTDLEHGNIKTGLGREWSTSDGGQTWKAR